MTLTELYAERRRIAHEIRVAEAARMVATIRARQGESGTFIGAAADLYDVTIEDILSTSREQRIARARQAACWLLRGRGLSYPEIGRIMGRDHTTVLHACRRIDAQPTVRALLQPYLADVSGVA